MSKKKFKNYKVYIIGNIKSFNSTECKERFLKAQKALEKVGFANIINPLDHEPNLTSLDRKRSNYMQLVDSNAVYILSNVAIPHSNNIEIKIAKELELLIIHDHTES